MKAHPHAPVAFFFFALAPAFAQGQEPAEQAIVLEEIIVTAALRELALQDTPMSLGVLTGCDLRDIGAISIDDVWRNIPNLAVRDSPFGGRSFIIRGCSSPTCLMNARNSSAAAISSTRRSRPPELPGCASGGRGIEPEGQWVVI